MKMKNTDLGRFLFLIALGAFVLPACQTAPPAHTSEPVCRTETIEKPEVRTVVGPRGEPLKDSKVVSQLEKRIKRTKGEQMLISKSLLRALVDEDRLAKSETARLGAQLEALKKVDLNDGSHTAD